MKNFSRTQNQWLLNLGILLFLISTAIYLRLPDLGVLGFYGDEETTAFPAKSLASGGGLNMPSGLPYYRATPLTLLNAVSASLFGVDNELSYRAPAVLLGALTPFVMFLLSRSLVPTFIAVAASVLLVFSEWHVLTSREARMYGPFLLMFLSTGLLYCRWADKLTLYRTALLSALSGLTLLMHALGFLVVLFPLAWLTIKGDKESNWKVALLFIAFVVSFYLTVNNRLILAAFSNWISDAGQSAMIALVPAEPIEPFYLRIELTLFHVLGIVGLLSGGWLGRNLNIQIGEGRPWYTKLGVMFLSVLFGVFLFSAHYYAAGLTGISLLLIQPVRDLDQLLKCRRPIIFMGAAGAAVALFVLFTSESTEDLKQHVLFPYPYFAYFWSYSKVLFILFWLGVLSTLLPSDRKWEANVRVFALVAIGIIASVGIAERWGGIRFLIGAYPFILLVACTSLHKINSLLLRWGRVPGYAGSVALVGILCAGGVDGHGWKSATEARDITYGVSNRSLTLGFDIYPDHKGAGEYVRQRAGANDIVIAEDVLQQFWYLGRDLHWLRDEKSNARFMYLDPAGVLRDIYVNSRVLLSNSIDSECENRDGIVWLITSAEVSSRRSGYLSQYQQELFERIVSVSHMVFVGRDDTTKVYKTTCGLLE